MSKALQKGNMPKQVRKFRGCLHEQKRPSYSPLNCVFWLAGISLIFVYMRAFVPVCRDEYIVGYCFEFSLV